MGNSKHVEMSKSTALVWIVVAYMVALFAGGASLFLLDYNPLLDILIADIVATLVIFGFSRWFHNSSFYDAYWSVIPPLIALYWLAVTSTEPTTLRTFLMLGLMLYWATRLTLNWAVHWQGIMHEDWRYVMLKQKFPGTAFLIDLGGIHLFPTFQVFAGMLPVYAVLCLSDAPFNWLDIVATFVTFNAITLQMVSDVQLHAFNATKQPGDSIRTGLWGWSRHPNYLGEIGFWFGLFLFGMAAYPAGWYWMSIGFVAMTLMFVYASIPMMEKRSLERRPDYQTVIDSVSMLIPLPPKKR